MTDTAMMFITEPGPSILKNYLNFSDSEAKNMINAWEPLLTLYLNFPLFSPINCSNPLPRKINRKAHTKPKELKRHSSKFPL